MPPSLYRLGSTVLLPFRTELPDGRTSSTIGVDHEPTEFAWAYTSAFRMDGAPGAASTAFEMPTPHHTLMSVSFPQHFNGDRQDYRTWLQSGQNSGLVILREVLPRLNHFLAAVQFGGHAETTTTLRTVGELDLMFHNLTFEDEAVYSRASHSFLAGVTRREHLEVPERLPGRLPAEWLLLSRAVGLVNHGSYTEAVLVGFSVLDLQVQRFLEPRLGELTAAEGAELLRVVESRRLKRYLGLMMRLAVGTTPLDDKAFADELAWLNELRNGLVHRAEECSMDDAQKALRFVKTTLDWLNANGAGLDVPATLGFWTPVA